ncbi:MAG: PAS domain-containing protein, partial [Nannocystaceae bacterium]
MSHLPIDFLDTSISPIFVTDVDTNCLYVNEAMRDALTLGADVDPNALELPGLLHRDSEWFIAQHQRIEADGSAIISLKLSSDGRDGDSLWFVVTAFHPSGTEAPQYVFMGVPAAVADRITHANTSASGSSASIENQRVMVDARLASCMEYLRNCNAPAETMEIIFRAAREIFDGAHVELFVVDLEAEMLELRWSSEEAPARTVSHDACWAVRRRRLHYWGPESAEMRCSHDSGEGETSRFCAPISGHDGPLAILSVGFDDRALPDEGA